MRDASSFAAAICHVERNFPRRKGRAESSSFGGAALLKVRNKSQSEREKGARRSEKGSNAATAAERARQSEESGERIVLGRSAVRGRATPWEIVLNLLNSKLFTPRKKSGESFREASSIYTYIRVYTPGPGPARHINTSCTEEGNLFKICSLSRHFAMVVCHGE